MRIGADENVQIARLLYFLLQCEQLAQTCSASQARLTHSRLMRRFLTGQSQQERAHAHVFKSAVLWLAPKGVDCPALAVIKQYESILNDALRRGDLTETLLGMQVILEGMGNIVLNRFSQGSEDRDRGFNRLRRVFLMQEASHHAFGLEQLEDRINNSRQPSSQLKNRTTDYLGLIHDALNSLHGLFEYFDEDSSMYLKEFHQQLPRWVNRNALDHYTHS